MKPKPPFYPQAYDFSCVPACLRMVMSALGLDITEVNLRQMCETGSDGTSPSKAVLAAKSLGFEASSNAYYKIGDLQQLLREGIYPIVYIKRQGKHNHSVVVTKIQDGKVFINDPIDESRDFLSQENFEEEWQLMNGQTIVIEQN